MINRGLAINVDFCSKTFSNVFLVFSKLKLPCLHGGDTAFRKAEFAKVKLMLIDTLLNAES